MLKVKLRLEWKSAAADDRFAIRRNSFPAEAAKRQANTGKGRAAVQKTIKQSPHDQRPASSGSRTSLHKQKPSSSSGAVASDQDIRDLLQPADPNVTFELGTGSENHHQDLAGQMTSQDVLMGEQSAPEPQLSCATNGAIVDVSLYDSEMADLTESARKDPSEPLTNPEDAAPLLGAPLLGAFQDGQPRPDRLRSSSPDAMGTAMGVTGPGNSDDAKGWIVLQMSRFTVNSKSWSMTLLRRFCSKTFQKAGLQDQAQYPALRGSLFSCQKREHQYKHRE